MSKADIGKLMIGNIRLTMLFKDSYLDLLKIEKDMKAEVKKLDFSKEFYFSGKKIEFLESFKQNFFTLLVLSILKQSGIKDRKLVEYGKVIYCLRTIITCTDNIIDNENKGVLFLKTPKNPVVNNVLLLMVCQNILINTLNNLGDDKREVARVILEKIHRVAESEGLRDEGLYRKYPSPQEIVEKIHRGIGGELLQLSLWAPMEIEKSASLEKFNRGLHDIGMALQGLDDLSDMEEDLDAEKVNLGVSHLINTLSFEKNSLKLKFWISDENISGEFRSFLSRYTKECIEKSLEGFEKLEEGGYPVSREDATILMRILFKLRGLEKLWDIGYEDRQK
ncbi:class 1 isoprenoid biosynthesis enzyme [uncultured Ilyobacter sp.]|uniref:class 1 isoprenoid biosynthesis enzyme n=1 Tax=uncultured Ilyobacter sp. TaxID=544433 RepID=UPI0029C06DB6|nr:class 1 isoprenoid biosynthesis enzyme [uncultured Ilyobacter sp.]